MWPGSDVSFDGYLPSLLDHFNASTTQENRIERILEWIDLPTDKRPSLIAAYIGDIDREGHKSGPHFDKVHLFFIKDNTRN